MELSENGRATSVVGCVGGRGTGRHECGRGRRSKILTTGGGSGMQQSASRHSTIESHQRTTRPVPRYSRHPPVPAHSPARPSVPFTLPPPTQAGRAATDVLLFDPPTPAASAWVWSVSLQFPLVSPTTPPPPRGGDSRGLSGARTGTDGQVGNPVCGSTCWLSAFDCTRRRCCCSTTNSSTL